MAFLSGSNPHWTEYSNNFYQFCEKMFAELQKQDMYCDKETSLMANIALQPYAIEAIMNGCKERGEGSEAVYQEVVKLAAMAYRLATDGSEHYDGYKGTKCHYAGCNQPTVGGPCALCYE